MSYLIKDTTKQQRIEIIKQWVPEEGSLDESDMDLWDQYADYINGTREIAEINADLVKHYVVEG
ncbi:MAG: hypothetical protein ACI4DU_05500 [Lachnospiraceae bacterium]